MGNEKRFFSLSFLPLPTILAACYLYGRKRALKKVFFLEQQRPRKGKGEGGEAYSFIIFRSCCCLFWGNRGHASKDIRIGNPQRRAFYCLTFPHERPEGQKRPINSVTLLSTYRGRKEEILLAVWEISAWKHEEGNAFKTCRLICASRV